MDINAVLAAIGGIMGAFNVSESLGQAFLGFVEFWLVGFETIAGLFGKITG
jgi:hypothetical protein